MKNCIASVPFKNRLSDDPNQRFKVLILARVAVVAALELAAGRSQASNLLINPSFEANSGHAVATGWTYFSPPTPPGYFGDYWIEGNVPAHAGSLYWKQWSALNSATNVAGIFQ